MTFLDVLRNARRRPSTALHQLRLEYKKHARTVHAFLEGQEDECFYTQFVEASLPPKHSLRVHRCGSKQSVYDVFGRMDWTAYDNRRVLFFVDKDLSDILAETYPAARNIYVTDYYAVENYLVSRDIVSKVMRQVMHLDYRGKTQNDVLRLFAKQNARFCLLLRRTMAWIIYYRQHGQALSLDNIKMGQLFAVDDDLTIRRKLPKKYASQLRYLESVCNVTREPGFNDEIREVLERLRTYQNPKIYIRGKYELWFLLSFVEALARKAKAKMHVSLGMNNAMVILAPKVQIPKSLRRFLQANLALLSSGAA